MIKIGGRLVGAGQPCFIIAEAGVNHNGSVSLAKKMVDAAKAAGADAIKFQTFRTDKLLTQKAPKAEYQERTVPGKSQYEMIKSLELPFPAFKELRGYCRRRSIIFLSTPFDPESAEFLNRLNIPAFKISSGELTNAPLLAQIARYGKPIILSTGMADLKEVKDSLELIRSAGGRKILLLHCTSNYPTRYEDVNLKAMQTLRDAFKLPVGYSDHTIGIEVSVAAVALGATMIEKHFTLDKRLPGPDHEASLDPVELKAMVKAVREIEAALGDGVKKPRPTEEGVKKVARKSVVAASDIPRGQRISAAMLAVKRPGTGLPPRLIGKIIGRKALRMIRQDDLLSEKDFS